MSRYYHFSILTPEINVFSLYGDTICDGSVTAFSLETINTDSTFIYRENWWDIFYVGDTSISYPGWYSYMIEVDTEMDLPCVSNQYIQIAENDLSIDSIKIVDECAQILVVLKFLLLLILP